MFQCQGPFMLVEACGQGGAGPKISVTPPTPLGQLGVQYCTSDMAQVACFLSSQVLVPGPAGSCGFFF